ncbi:MAG TPA: VIT1/CCC1 transporter family protein [Xanthobacteraceae bacterium]|nr:VIT1/CCC1 transporter family protein [Xanthobacteraceae bacterium]
MTIASTLRRLRDSLTESAGTIVFGMEDGTVSIFGLIFGVAATTTNSKTVLIAGASGAVAAAVSMMAGAYLDAETTLDEINAKRALGQSEAALDAASASLPTRLAAAGLSERQSAALANAVQHDRTALGGLLLALQGESDTPFNPWQQALWMLIADFFAAAVPIVPFVMLPVPQARWVSGAVTIALLVALGFGRSRIAKRGALQTISETVTIGVAAALAGVFISIIIDRGFSG